MFGVGLDAEFLDIWGESLCQASKGCFAVAQKGLGEGFGGLILCAHELGQELWVAHVALEPGEYLAFLKLCLEGVLGIGVSQNRAKICVADQVVEEIAGRQFGLVVAGVEYADVGIGIAIGL